MLKEKRHNFALMTVAHEGKTWFAAALVLTLLCASPSFAQNIIHVPADAPTIQAAIDAAHSGDTVLVAAGTYNENIDFKGKAITVTSGAQSFAEAASTIINVVGDGAGVTFHTGETSSATLNGFTVENGHTNPADCTVGGGIYITGASPTISNNAIRNNENYGLYIADQASPLILANNLKGTYHTNFDLTSCHTLIGVSGGGNGTTLMNAGSPQIVGNVIEENGDTTEGAAYSQGAGINIFNANEVLIKDNIIRNNTATEDGAILAQGFQALALVQNLIYGNVPSGNSEGNGTQLTILGPFLSTTYPTLTETNNTIYGAGESVLLFFGPSRIENNIFANPIPATGSQNFSGGLLCDVNALKSPFTVQNNDIFTLGVSSPYACNFPGNNINADPKLRDPASGDFHEQQFSPTVATGDLNAADIPAADLDKKARTVCNTIDMGAYELRPHPPIALSSSADPAPGGSSLIFTAHLTGNCNTPTGSLTFFDGSNAVGAAVLDASGTAILTTSLLVVGQHNITAQYLGDFNFDESTSNVLVETITGDPTATSLAVAPNPASAFSPITLSSTVTSQYGTPTGSVAFTAGGAALATASLDGSGKASARISNLGAGTYTVVANYLADTRFQPSSSPAVKETVIGANSTTSLSASLNPAAVSQVIVFTATARDAQGSTTPTGQVSFSDGASVLGSAALNGSGIATLTASTLSFGTHQITASYGGSANFNPSSATLSEAITLIGTSLALAASPNPANAGQAVTMTATATAALTGTVPGGTINFNDGSTTLGSAVLSNNGIATFSTSSLAVGTHPLTAILRNGPSFGGSSSLVVNEVIQAYDFTLALSRAAISIPSGDYSNMTVTVTPVGGFTGTVSLSCGGVPDHTQCVFPQGSTVSLSNGAKTVKLSINTSDVYGNGKLISRSAPFRNGSKEGDSLAVVLLPALSLLGLAGGRRKRVQSACFAIAVMAGVVCLQSCSGKLPGETPPGNYPLTVVGTSTSGIPGCALCS